MNQDKIYIQDNIIKEVNCIYYDRDTDKPYRYIGKTGISFTLSEEDWKPAFEIEQQEEEPPVFVDIKAEPHEIFIDRCSSQLDIYIKYLKRYIETIDDKVSEKVRYNYCNLVVGEDVYKLDENVKILNGKGITYIHATASPSSWDIKSEIDMYVRQFDGAKYPYRKEVITGNDKNITYTASGKLTVNIITNEDKRSFPSLLDKGNEITSVTILGSEIKTLKPEVRVENTTVVVTVSVSKTELSNLIEGDLLPIAIDYNSTIFGIPFKSNIYIRKEDIPKEPAIEK